MANTLFNLFSCIYIVQLYKEDCAIFRTGWALGPFSPEQQFQLSSANPNRQVGNLAANSLNPNLLNKLHVCMPQNIYHVFKDSLGFLLQLAAQQYKRKN